MFTGGGGGGGGGNLGSNNDTGALLASFFGGRPRGRLIGVGSDEFGNGFGGRPLFLRGDDEVFFAGEADLGDLPLFLPLSAVLAGVGMMFLTLSSFDAIYLAQYYFL